MTDPAPPGESLSAAAPAAGAAVPALAEAVLRVLGAVAAALSLAGFAWLAWLHLLMVAADTPMEMRDGAVLATTVALVDGRNPYALPGVATSGNIYGLLYPVAVLPAALLLGAGFAVHRLVAALCILGTCAILFRWLRLAGVGRLDALLGTALVYAGAIYFTGAVARPDGLGLLLMLAAVEVMRRGDLSVCAFAGGLALSLLGLLAKLYFVWPAYAAAAYVFLCRGVWRGLAYGIAAILATAATLALVGWLLPGYTAAVFLSNLGAASYDSWHLLRQIRDWSLFDLPLLVAAAALLFLARREEAWRPVRDPGLFVAMAAFGVVALLGALGGHVGAHLSYFFQLLSPFLAVVVLGAAASRPLALAAFRIALVPALLLNAHWFPVDPARFARAGAGFAEAARLIDDSRLVLATTEFAGQLALRRRPLAETGHAEYFDRSAAARLPDWMAPFAPSPAERAAEWQRLQGGIRAAVEARRYDLILLGQFPSPLIPRAAIEANYRRVGAIEIDMPWALQRWPVQVWRPLP